MWLFKNYRPAMTSQQICKDRVIRIVLGQKQKFFFCAIVCETLKKQLLHYYKTGLKYQLLVQKVNSDFFLARYTALITTFTVVRGKFWSSN